MKIRHHNLLGTVLQDLPRDIEFSDQGLQIIDSHLIGRLWPSALGLDPHRPVIMWYLDDSTFTTQTDSVWWHQITRWLDQWHLGPRCAVTMDMAADLPGWCVYSVNTWLSRTRDWTIPRADLSRARSGWLCLNNTPRTHRVAMLALLQARSLLESATWTLSSWPDTNFMPDPEQCSQLVGKDARPFIDQLEPRTLPGDTNPLQLDQQPWSVWDQHLMALVSETQIGSRGRLIGEKTYRALAHGVPLILWAQPGTLAYLAELGFQTWPDCWDQSWDHIVDPSARLAAVVTALEQWLALPLGEQQSRIRAQQSTVDHNREIIAAQPSMEQAIGRVLAELINI